MKKVKVGGGEFFDRGPDIERAGKGLAGKFRFPPYSILKVGEGDWLTRKRQWLGLGIESEIGRDDNLLIRDKNLNNPQVYRDGAYEKKPKTLDTKNGEKWEPGKPLWQNSGTSIFDPVVCELMYQWFCPPKGQVVDPFAGGSVRGVVAAYMGYKYWGGELREEQVTANIEQGELITPNCQPTWVAGDSKRTLRHAPEADFIFSCPPYGNLEVYSDMEEDLSNKEYEQFLEMYRIIIHKSVKKLKDNRFACFVVGNFRDKKTGYYHDFAGDTIRAFEDAGMGYYNEFILFTAIGSLPVRAGKTFKATRKLGKSHQNVLVFFKGDVAQIKHDFN